MQPQSVIPIPAAVYPRKYSFQAGLSGTFPHPKPLSTRRGEGAMIGNSSFDQVLDLGGDA